MPYLRYIWPSANRLFFAPEQFSGVQPMRVLIATTNPGKVREYQALLDGLDLELVGLNDVGITTEVEESGGTYAENAELKARAYATMSGLLTLADDSGIEVEALNGRPGLHSARYAEDSAKRIEKLLGELQGVPDEKRTARFQCSIALAWPDGRVMIVDGTCEGRIAHEPRGVNGFGYDPIFYLLEYAATMAELPEDVKNRISHRARAAQRARVILAKITRES
jgi:XTP/dITP diphosphohydrolase